MRLRPAHFTPISIFPHQGGRGYGKVSAVGKERLTLRNIILTGYPGTGKSTVGQVVARILGWRFIDVDREVAEKAGKTIAAIFEEHGEEHFRQLERDAVREACAGQGRVVAVGGGAITFPENRETMEAAGVVVCLDALPETIHQRLQEQKRQYAEERRYVHSWRARISLSGYASKRRNDSPPMPRRTGRSTPTASPCSKPPMR